MNSPNKLNTLCKLLKSFQIASTQTAEQERQCQQADADAEHNGVVHEQEERVWAPEAGLVRMHEELEQEHGTCRVETLSLDWKWWSVELYQKKHQIQFETLSFQFFLPYCFHPEYLLQIHPSQAYSVHELIEGVDHLAVLVLLTNGLMAILENCRV